MNIIYNAKILTMEESETVDGYLCWDNGTISDICAGEPQKSLIKTAESAIDAQGGILMPGLIDAHTHIGGIGDALGFESDDINEVNDPICPQLSAIDCINPLDRCFTDAVRAGITTVSTGPGSANPIAGRFVTIKTAGKRIDNMVIKAPGAMKMALGENPKSCYHTHDQSPETRMSIAALIREALSKAKRYGEDIKSAKENEDDLPDYDAKCEALLPCLEGKLPVHFHAHRADDIFTAIRIANEFSLKYTIVHCTEGHLVADELKQENVNALVGPIICDRSKPELANLSVQNASILAENGIEFAIISDHPEVPCSYLLTSAAIAVKAGLDRYEALKALTVNPAEILGIDSRVGTLRAGKDADMVLFDGDPLETFSQIKAVWIDGKKQNI